MRACSQISTNMVYLVSGNIVIGSYKSWVGNLFSSKVHLGIYNHIHGPYKIKNEPALFGQAVVSWQSVSTFTCTNPQLSSESPKSTFL